MKKQMQMFSLGEDLPLFSGTPAISKNNIFVEANSSSSQIKMSKCPICYDTGLVFLNGRKKHCVCGFPKPAIYGKGSIITDSGRKIDYTIEL